MLQYLNDCTLKNIHWSMCTGIFGNSDIGLIEREYLDVINFDLRIYEVDLLKQQRGLAAAICLKPAIHSAELASPSITKDQTICRSASLPL